VDVDVDAMAATCAYTDGMHSSNEARHFEVRVWHGKDPAGWFGTAVYPHVVVCACVVSAQSAHVLQSVGEGTRFACSVPCVMVV
jgi:hypothetical protein